MNYAGFWRRALAFLIDALILMVPNLIFGAARDVFFSFGVGFIISFMYYPFFESSALLGTPGKALLGLVVVHEDSASRLTFRAAVIRFFCKYLSMMTFFIGYLIQPFTKRRQTLHDMISEAVVVRQEPIDANYFKFWKDQLKKVVADL